MRLVSFCLTLLVCMLLATTSQAQQEQPPVGKNLEGRRCAYLGYWGSFHLIGTDGSAAYTLDNIKYIAHLRSTGDDVNFWYYSPSNGDPTTTHWAFARKPDSCGMYWVWRADRGRWSSYEPTRAWGIGLGSQFTQTSVSPGLESRVTDLETRVKKLEDKY